LFSGLPQAAEIFDPASGLWSLTGAQVRPRYFHTATLLPGGKVLVVGGYGSAGYLPNAELFDPSTGGWTATGPLGTARQGHDAVLLGNGRVLVQGGFLYSTGTLSSSELYETPVAE
jgi:hypothetical protein